jgi:hypothetical protein
MPWQRKEWCRLLEKNVEFVATMEDVLKVYTKTQEPDRHLVCMDKCASGSRQLIGEVRSHLS